MKRKQPMLNPWLDQLQRNHQERKLSALEAEKLRQQREALRRANETNPLAMRKRYGRNRHGRMALAAVIIAASMWSK